MKESFKNKKYDKTTKLSEEVDNRKISNKDNWVVNLSNKNLLKDKRKVLLLGFNFAVLHGEIPKIDVPGWP